MNRNRALMVAALSCGTFHPNAEARVEPVARPLMVAPLSAPKHSTRNPLLVLKAFALAVLRGLN